MKLTIPETEEENPNVTVEIGGFSFDFLITASGNLILSVERIEDPEHALDVSIDKNLVPKMG